MTKKRKAASPILPCQNESDPKVISSDQYEELKGFIVRENAKSVEAIRESNERRLAAIEDSLSFTMDTVSTVAARQQSADRDIIALRKDNEELRNRVLRLELQEDRRQQDIRLVCLLFSGPAVQTQNRRAEATELIMELIYDRMRYDMDRNQIKTAFRLKNGEILMEFTTAASGSDRDVLFRSKTKLEAQVCSYPSL